MANDTSKLIVGGGELSLVLGTDTVPVDDAAYDAGIDFGNITTLAPSNESTGVEHMGMYKGVKVRDDYYITAIKQGFKVTCDEFNEIAHRAMFFGAAGVVDGTDDSFTNYTPLTGANSLKGYARLRIYDGRDNANPVIEWKDFTCVVKMSSPPSYDGENYSSYELEVLVLGVVGTAKVKNYS